MKDESDVFTDYNWSSWYSHRSINKGTGGLGNERMSGDHAIYYIIEIDQNTEKSLGHMRGFAVTQPLVKDYQLTLMRKTRKEYPKSYFSKRVNINLTICNCYDVT